ncbi:touch receptor neuron protein Mec-17-domain-containing protein [Chytriomyces sp. MP71]|nr:touch receptor neuron protein Mec-17-domain-containing protein [Chytriomyces sp. MP71]
MRSESPTGDTGDTAIDAGENDAPTIADLERSGTTRAREKQYQVLGFLKIGVKCLFVSDDIGRQIQISPLCLLDFYITETHQRLGYGKTLFECMLANEGVSASKLAYDRPSPRMVGFLKKHYALQETLPQANNYLFFKEVR